MKISPGKVIVDRYEILHEIGSGGMGVVYAAHDRSLDRHVALKFIAATYDLDDTGRRRLFREARAASGLDHPNICTVYGLEESEDGQPFIAMTYYEGRSLKELISEGALPPDEALNVSIQAARGLSHAHAHGVVHRDIKPGNLLITEGGTVKILDFGIARRSGQDLGQTGPLVGTLAFMSPEQFEDGPAGVRSDVWSLGVVMYTLFSGQTPFRAQNEAALINRITNEDPEPLEEISDVPPAIAKVVHRCLSKASDDRFADGTEVLEELIKASDPAAAPSESPRRARRLGLFAGAALATLLVLSLTPMGQRLVEQVFARVSPPARYVAVLSFEAADSAHAAIATGLTQSITEFATDLAAIDEELWVLQFPDMVNAGIGSVSEARRTYPVDIVVTGRVRDTADGPVLELEAVDVRSTQPRVLASTTVDTSSRVAVRSAVHQLLAEPLRLSDSTIGERVRDPVQESPGFVLYTSGLGLLHRSFVPGNLESAVRLFEDALLADSNLVAARAGLCQARWEQYMTAKSPARADTASVVCAEAVERSDSDARVLVALGRTQIQFGQTAQAETTLRRAVAANGTDAEAHRWLGLALEGQGRWDAAEASYQQAIQLQPELWVYEFELGLMLTYAERHEEAIERFQRVVDLSPDNYRGHNALGFAQLALGRFDDAEVALTASLGAQENFLAYRNLGLLHLRARSYAEAVAGLTTGLEINPSDWWSWRWLAHARHWLDQPAESRAAWERVIELTAEHLSVNPSDVDALGGRSEALAQLGRTEEARQSLDQLMVAGVSTGYNTFLVGRLLEMLGSRQAAIAQLVRALELGVHRDIIETDPWLVDLVADSLYPGQE